MNAPSLLFRQTPDTIPFLGGVAQQHSAFRSIRLAGRIVGMLFKNLQRIAPLPFSANLQRSRTLYAAPSLIPAGRPPRARFH